MKKQILITGANGNLGVATVQKFLDEGYYVIAVDGNNSNLAFAMSNPSFQFYAVNLTKEDETAGFVESIIIKHGQIHGALLLVGGFAMGTIEETTGPVINKMFSLNFETAYFVARPLLKHMKQYGYGRLAFIGARPALKAEQGKVLVAYALTKSLLFTLADFINEETKGTNVVASVVIPGTIDTPLNRENMPAANAADWVTSRQVADVLEFICSEAGNPIREAVYKVYNNA